MDPPGSRSIGIRVRRAFRRAVRLARFETTLVILSVLPRTLWSIFAHHADNRSRAEPISGRPASCMRTSVISAITES